MQKCKNRYGDEWHLEKLTQNEYLFVMQGDSMKYCRFGGKEFQNNIDPTDLGFFDPSGGPFIAVGAVLDGLVSDPPEEGSVLTVEKISSTLQGIVLTMKTAGKETE